MELDGEAGLAELLDERRHVAEPRLGCERLVRVVAKHAEHAAHLGESAAAGLLDRLQHLARRAVRSAEHAPLCTRLHHHDRDVVGDHVVQLTRDPCALLDDRLARGHVALALGDPRAALAVADDAADEEHHDDRADGERACVVQVPLRVGSQGEVERHDQCQAECKAARWRPNGQPVQRAEIGDGGTDDLRITPEAQLDREKRGGGDTRNRGIETPKGDCRCDQWRDDCGNQLLMCGAASEPDLELCANREQDGENPVEAHRVGPEAIEASEVRAHASTVDAGWLRVISRLADPAARKLSRSDH